MKKEFWFILLIIVLLIGCGTMNDTYQNKLDPDLSRELSNENKIESEETIQFLGKCKTEITADLKTELEQTGIDIQSVIKAIFTASGTRKQIIECAKIESVIRLEKSKTIYPLDNSN